MDQKNKNGLLCLVFCLAMLTSFQTVSVFLLPSLRPPWNTTVSTHTRCPPSRPRSLDSPQQDSEIEAQTNKLPYQRLTVKRKTMKGMLS